MDGYGLLSRYGKEKLMKHIIWSRELASRGRWIEEYEKKMGRPPTRLTIVYDLQGLNSRHMKSGVLPFLADSMRITQQRYNGLAKVSRCEIGFNGPFANVPPSDQTIFVSINDTPPRK